MRNSNSFNSLFSHDRKLLYIILSIVMPSVLTLTVVYAALSTTLNINGNAEVTAASWDIYLDNVELNSNSATTNVPTITDKTTATFSTTLSKPGDYYMFTVDVVNNGTIDAMINSITKTPELTDVQKKYLNYIVEYQNGESITTKQLVSKNSFVRLKVRVEYRKDLVASDLPIQSETLNLSFTLNYVQSDDSSENVTIDNNGKLIKVVSGDYNTVGSEICIGEECFYVISSDEDSVTMLAKYNLHVGNSFMNKDSDIVPLENSTGIQSSDAKGSMWEEGDVGEPWELIYPWIGTIEYSTTKYWWDNDLNEFKGDLPADLEFSGNSYPYIYNSNSILYKYVENYRAYLMDSGVSIEEARLLRGKEILLLGCELMSGSCKTAPEWVYSTSYWTGSSGSGGLVVGIYNTGVLSTPGFDTKSQMGIRPVIVMSIK